MPEGAVYVGRPTRWGNPYQEFSPLGNVSLYRQRAVLRLRLQPDWLAPLRGHDLACWCPEACGESVALYGVAYGDLYEPCAKPKGHEGGHDPSVAPWCHADVLLELPA
jgi:Domain of unknown function (DUF4326)